MEILVLAAGELYAGSPPSFNVIFAEQIPSTQEHKEPPAALFALTKSGFKFWSLINASTLTILALSICLMQSTVDIMMSFFMKACGLASSLVKALHSNSSFEIFSFVKINKHLASAMI